MKRSTSIISAFIALIILGLGFVCGRGIVQEAVYPIENARAWFVRHPLAGIKAVFHPAETAQENRRLKLENSTLHLLENDLVRLRNENEHLRKMLEYQASTAITNRWVCAPVLSRNGAGGVKGLIRVGRGSLDGVRVDATVAVPAGLVGRVEQVSPHTADVRLITSPSVKVACTIVSADPALGTVRGILEGGGEHLFYSINPLRIRHLKTGSLPPNAKIITNGLGGIFPPGLTVGYLIDGCNADETHLEHEGAVEPAVDFPALEDVFICREN